MSLNALDLLLREEDNYLQWFLIIPVKTPWEAKYSYAVNLLISMVVFKQWQIR